MMNGLGKKTSEKELLSNINEANDMAELIHERKVTDAALEELEKALPETSSSRNNIYDDETVPGNAIQRRSTLESVSETAEVVTKGLTLFSGNGARLAALTIVGLFSLLAFAIWQLKDHLP